MAKKKTKQRSRKSRLKEIFRFEYKSKIVKVGEWWVPYGKGGEYKFKDIVVITNNTRIELGHANLFRFLGKKSSILEEGGTEEEKEKLLIDTIIEAIEASPGEYKKVENEQVETTA